MFLFVDKYSSTKRNNLNYPAIKYLLLGGAVVVLPTNGVDVTGSLPVVVVPVIKSEIQQSKFNSIIEKLCFGLKYYTAVSG